MTAIVVLGMHRSGTSLAAALLQRVFGVRMTEHINYSDDQPDGYWEDPYFKAINKRILAAAEGSWRNPPVTAEIVSAVKEDEQLQQDMRELVDERTMATRVWGWKDPRTALTWPVWWLCLKRHDVRMLIMHRKADDIVDSLQRRALRNSRDVIATEKWHAVVEHYKLQLELNETTCSRVAHVLFYRLVSPQTYVAELDKISKLLRLPLNRLLLDEAARVIKFRKVRG